MNKQLCELLRRMGEAEVQHGRGRQLRQSVVMVMAMALVMLIHSVGDDARKWIVVDACFVIAGDAVVFPTKDLMKRLLLQEMSQKLWELSGTNREGECRDGLLPRSSRSCEAVCRRG